MKIRRGFSNLFNATSCHHSEIVKMGIVSSESKPDAFVGDGATFMLWVGPPLQENTTFSLKGKMLIGLTLYFVFKVAHVHLPVVYKILYSRCFF